MKRQDHNSVHYPWLDMVRFLSALVVVMVHARGTLFVDYGSLDPSDQSIFVAMAFVLTRLGHEAVLVFFVLSGFLVGGRVIARVRDGSFRPNDYAIDRFVRIMLPLVPALILTAAVYWMQHGVIDVDVMLFNLLSLQGVVAPVFGDNGPLWSLAYEVWFYILAYALGMLVIQRGFHWPSVLLIVATVAVFFFLSPVYLLCWVVGALAYVWRPRAFNWLTVLAAITIMLCGIAIIQLNSGSQSFSADDLGFRLPSSDVARIGFSIAAALLVQQLLILQPRRPASLTINQLGTQLAAFSYTLYLTHYPVLQLISYLGAPRASSISVSTVSLFAAGVMICIAVAWLLYLCFEKHTAIARRFLKRKWGVAGPATIQPKPANQASPLI